MRFHALMLAAGLTVLGGAVLPVSSFAADKALTAAVASSNRPAGDKARDGARHPAASLEFWGLKPGQTVIEIAPGGGYWSEILAPYASNTHGHYIAAMGREGQKLPARFADTKTYGLELEGGFYPVNWFDLTYSSTLENPKYVGLVYTDNVGGQPVLRDFNGHQLIRVPKVSVRIVPGVNLFGLHSGYGPCAAAVNAAELL